MADATTTTTLRPRPGLLWRLFVLGGVGTMAAVTVNDEAWEQFRGVTGDSVSREQVRQLLVGTAAVHAGEAVLTLLRARRIGVAHPWRWAFANLVWGFPVMFRLGRAKRALRAAPAVAPADAAPLDLAA
jgi:hypothetical protein